MLLKNNWPMRQLGGKKEINKNMPGLKNKTQTCLLIHCVNSQNRLIVETACKPWWQQCGGKRAGFYPADVDQPCTQLPPPTKSLTKTNDTTLSSPRRFPSHPKTTPLRAFGLRFPITLLFHTSNIIWHACARFKETDNKVNSCSWNEIWAWSNEWINKTLAAHGGKLMSV